MKPLFLRPLLCALPLVSLACLENEEEITVRPDGSLHVKVSAKGDVADLAQGYPVPLAAPWRPANDGAREWLAQVGGATGGAVALARIGDERVLGKPDTERELAVEAEFASVDALPARFADPADPYADAYLARSASLQVLQRGTKTVYVFERTLLQARPYGREIFERMLEEEDEEREDLLEKFQAGSFSDQEWKEAFDDVANAHRSMAHAFVWQAFVPFYIRGSASISASAMESLWTRLGERVHAIFAIPRLKQLPKEDEALGAAWTEMYGEFRDSIREEVARTLEDAGIANEERNAVAFALEREFTLYDQSVDLADETFRIRITLPGQLVAGNFLDWSGPSTANFEIGGHELLLGDVTLRAVSVVE